MKQIIANIIFASLIATSFQSNLLAASVQNENMNINNAIKYQTSLAAISPSTAKIIMQASKLGKSLNPYTAAFTLADFLRTKGYDHGYPMTVSNILAKDMGENQIFGFGDSLDPLTILGYQYIGDANIIYDAIDKNIMAIVQKHKELKTNDIDSYLPAISQDILSYLNKDIEITEEGYISDVDYRISVGNLLKIKPELIKTFDSDIISSILESSPFMVVPYKIIRNEIGEGIPVLAFPTTVIYWTDNKLIDKNSEIYKKIMKYIGEILKTPEGIAMEGSSGGDDPGENNIPTTIDTDQSSNCTKVRLMPKMFFLNGRLYIPTPDYIRNKEEVSRWANTNGVNILLPQGFDQDNPTTHPNNIEITGFVRGGGGFCCTTQDSSRGRPDEEPYNRVVSYTNGYTYDGEYANGNPNGHGIMTFPNGDRYDGQWRDGFRHGHGGMSYANGDVYDGQWRYGLRNGHGIMTYDNGDRYDGEWWDGNRNGHGIMTYANGDRYTGRWFRGDLRRGQMRYANGDVYDGAWANGQRNGTGVMVYGNGERYDGAWLNGQRNGNGGGMAYVLPWADLFFQA